MDWDYPDYNPLSPSDPGRNSTDPKEKADYNQDNPNP